MVELEAAIVGAGPAGLAAALYLKRAGISFVLLDKMGPGGKLNNIHEIANMPGFLPISGLKLANELYASVKEVGVDFSYGEVVGISRGGRGFLVETDVETYSVYGVVVATGFVYEAVVKGEKELRGQGISYCATCDGPIYRGKETLVYGEGSRAEEEADYLSGICPKVYFVSKSRSLSIKKPNVVPVLDSEIVAFEKRDGLIVAHIKGPEGEREIGASACFPLYGERSALAFLSGLEVKEERGYLLVDERMKTSVDGLFAAGDIVKKGLRQVVTALSDGAVAATSLASYVRGRRKNG